MTVVLFAGTREQRRELLALYADGRLRDQPGNRPRRLVPRHSPAESNADEAGSLIVTCETCERMTIRRREYAGEICREITPSSKKGSMEIMNVFTDLPATPTNLPGLA